MKVFLISFLLMVAANANSQQIKVMSYNIRLDVASDGINQWSNRKEKLPALIAKYDPDLVGLQEAMHHQLMDILKALPQYGYIGVGRDDGKEKGEYSAILYKKDKFSVGSNKTSWLSETPDVPGSKSWDAAITRILTQGEFTEKKSGTKFLYMNTHFDHIGKEARKHSAELIVKEIKTSKLRTIVTGDFNSQVTEDPYKIISASISDARPAGSAQGTFCTFTVNAQPCTLIDHIFYSNKIKRNAYEVILDNDGTYYPSDHLPVMATFSFD